MDPGLFRVQGLGLFRVVWGGVVEMNPGLWDGVGLGFGV